MALVCKQRYASESMSDQDDWEFAGRDDAKAEIRAAGLPPEQGNPLDDGLPGG
jgi:hypothetical protein